MSPVSERAAMKRRVRGLLRRKWPEALGALVLANLPMLIAIGLVTLFMKPLTAGLTSLITQLTDLFEGSQDITIALANLLYTFEFDFVEFIAALPGQAVICAVYVFVSLPVFVSVSGYFLNFLRGKDPKMLSVLGCFSSQYPRALCGMLYRFLWSVLWGLMAFAAPLVLYNVGLLIVGEYGKELAALTQVYVTGALIAVCIVWFVVFFLLFINRLLAYSLTGVCLAAQPRLPAFRAVRLSRKLMRGCKWQLVGLYLSFATYYLPAILALALQILLPSLSAWFGLTEALQQTLGTILWAVTIVNLLVTVYVAPYAGACFRAFYIERKREALMDEEVTVDEFASRRSKQKNAS